MKTSNHNKFSFLLGVGLSAIALGHAWAQPAPATTPAIAPASTLASAAPTPDFSPPRPAPLASSPDGVIGGESINSVMDRLKQNSSPLTLNDMTAAQDVLARLDLLTQIEERLSKLEEAQKKHKNGGELASTYPSMGSSRRHDSEPSVSDIAALTALSDATGKLSTPGLPGIPTSPHVFAISGTGGLYSAVLEVDGHRFTVKEGAMVPNIGTVIAINATGVRVDNRGKTSNLPFGGGS